MKQYEPCKSLWLVAAISKVKWPPTRRSKGYFESPGISLTLTPVRAQRCEALGTEQRFFSDRSKIGGVWKSKELESEPCSRDGELQCCAVRCNEQRWGHLGRWNPAGAQDVHWWWNVPPMLQRLLERSKWSTFEITGTPWEGEGRSPVQSAFREKPNVQTSEQLIFLMGIISIESIVLALVFQMPCE